MPTLVLTATRPGQYAHVMGRRGIAIRAGLGQRAYVQATVEDDQDHGKVYLGLAESKVHLASEQRCGDVAGTWGWWCGGTRNSMPGLQSLGNIFVRSMRYNTGDVLGILIDCRAAPTLVLYKNGGKVHTVPIDVAAS